jgi:hypothetical protein
LISADDSKITLLVALSLNDYGAPIQEYKLYVNKGVNGSPFLEITDYDGSSPTYDLNVDQMIGTFKVFKGGLYRFKTKASNSIGSSAFSNELAAALAALPETPNAPTFDLELSNRFQNVLKWVDGVSLDIEVTGYKLYSDNGLPGNMFLIYDGT